MVAMDVKTNGSSKLPAAIYIRRSTDRQEQSIESQHAAIERFAAENGFLLVAKYCDDGISGTSVSRGKSFLQRVEDAQQHDCPWNTIITYDLSAFSLVEVA